MAKRKVTKGRQKKASLPTKRSVQKILLPEHLRIGYITYDVKSVDGHEMDLREAMGMHLIDQAEIHVSDSVTDIQALNTLIHEALHAIAYSYNLGLSSDSSIADEAEERIVNGIANGLTSLFADNPDMIEYIKIVCEKAKRP